MLRARLRLYKLLYRLGLLAPYWEVDRFRYLKRLTHPRPEDWRYADGADAAQFVGNDAVARITKITPPVYFYCDRRSLIEAEIIKTGAFQRRILMLGNDLIRSNSLVIDVGANIGAYALPWAACNDDVAVHCFEPHPRMCEKLIANRALNQLGSKVVIHQCAVSDHDGEAILNATIGSDGNQGLSTLNAGIFGAGRADQVSVPLVRLDDVFVAAKKKISLLKIDVQGHELEVLRGGKSILTEHRPTLIVEHEDLLCSAGEAVERKAAMQALFLELGYEVLYISRWGADLLKRVNWSLPLNGDLLALPMDRLTQKIIPGLG